MLWDMHRRGRAGTGIPSSGRVKWSVRVAIPAEVTFEQGLEAVEKEPCGYGWKGFGKGPASAKTQVGACQRVWE